MTVRVEHEGPVTIVTIDRPEVKNAVDGPTAVALFEAFNAFGDDDASSVAVLTGADDTFCSGADLKAISTGDGNRVKRYVPPIQVIIADAAVFALHGFFVECVARHMIGGENVGAQEAIAQIPVGDALDLGRASNANTGVRLAVVWSKPEHVVFVCSGYLVYKRA